jgi:hypothetical protein
MFDRWRNTSDNAPMNTSIVKAVPSGDFEEISIHMPAWEETFLSLVRQRKRIKYGVYTMPNLSKAIQDELSKGSYCDFILENTDWHFLIPKHGH